MLATDTPGRDRPPTSAHDSMTQKVLPPVCTAPPTLPAPPAPSAPPPILPPPPHVQRGTAIERQETTSNDGDRRCSSPGARRPPHLGCLARVLFCVADRDHRRDTARSQRVRETYMLPESAASKRRLEGGPTVSNTAGTGDTAAGGWGLARLLRWGTARTDEISAAAAASGSPQTPPRRVSQDGSVRGRRVSQDGSVRGRRVSQDGSVRGRRPSLDSGNGPYARPSTPRYTRARRPSQEESEVEPLAEGRSPEGGAWRLAFGHPSRGPALGRNTTDLRMNGEGGRGGGAVGFFHSAPTPDGKRATAHGGRSFRAAQQSIRRRQSRRSIMAGGATGEDTRSFRQSMLDGSVLGDSRVFSSRVPSQRRSWMGGGLESVDELGGPEREDSAARELGAAYSLNPLAWIGLASNPEAGPAETQRRDSARRYG